MVKYINNIKVIIVLAIVSIFFAFSSIQNNAKPVSEVEISFIGDNNLFISKTKVDKLLIQNNDYIKCVSKDNLDLKALENKLWMYATGARSFSYHLVVRTLRCGRDIPGSIRRLFGLVA